MTLNHWILQAMKQAEIDTSQYTPYSTRHASSSGAYQKGMPLDEVLQLGCWKNPSTFMRHYNLPIDKTSNTSNAAGTPDTRSKTIISSKLYIPKSGDPTVRKKMITRQLQTQVAKIKVKATKTIQSQLRRSRTGTPISMVMQSQPENRKRVKIVVAEENEQNTEEHLEPSQENVENNTESAQEFDVIAVPNEETAKQDLIAKTMAHEDILPQENDPAIEPVIEIDIEPLPEQEDSDTEIDVTGFDPVESTDQLSEQQINLLAFGSQSDMLQAQSDNPNSMHYGKVTVYSDEHQMGQDYMEQQERSEKEKLVKLSKIVQENGFSESQHFRDYEGVLMRMGIPFQWRSSNRTHFNIPIIGADASVRGFHKQTQTFISAPNPNTKTAVCITPKQWQGAEGDYILPADGKADKSTTPISRTVQFLLQDKPTAVKQPRTNVPSTTTTVSQASDSPSVAISTSANIVKCLRLQPFLDLAGALSKDQLENIRIVLNNTQSRFIHKTARLIRENLQRKPNQNQDSPQIGICVITMVTPAGREMKYKFRVD